MLISDVRKVTPAVMTVIFQAGGYLPSNTGVARVELLASTESATTWHHRLHLRYEDYRSLKTAPENVFIKLSKPNHPVSDRETIFYESLAPQMNHILKADQMPLPACYDAYYDPDQKSAHLILEDLTKSHQKTRDGLPPSKIHREKIMERLGFLHACWWQHPHLEKFASPHTEASLSKNEALYQERYETFAAFMKSKISIKHRDLLEKIVTGYPPRRRAAMLSGQGMTLVHRDTHPANFLYAFNDVKLIDWQSWRMDAGTDDVAYLIACHYPDKIRRFEERNLLQKYYATLQRAGVEGYQWEDLLYDYRASIARCIAFLLVAWTPEKGIEGWQRGAMALTAFEEWDGAAIYPG